MELTSSRLISALGQMGLHNHDARVYAALISFNSVDARELIEYVKISKPSVYESLQRLQDRGLVVKQFTKPAVYTPVSPQVAMDILRGEQNQASEVALKELTQLVCSRKNEEEEDAVWTVFGERNIEHKIREMITAARKHICCVMGEKYLPLFVGVQISAPVSIHLISSDPGIMSQAENILKGVDATIHEISLEKITRSKFFPGRKQDIHKYFDLENTFEIIIDGRETLFIPPLLIQKRNGLYSANEVVVCLAVERMRFIIDKITGENLYESPVETPETI